MMGSRESPSRRLGYHLCVNRMWKHVTIHAPTNRHQHLPRPESRTCYWLGPYATETEAQDEAQEEAEWNDYDVHRCPEVLPYIASVGGTAPEGTRTQGPWGLAIRRAAPTVQERNTQRPAPPVIAFVRGFRAEFSRSLHEIGCCGRLGKLHPSAIQRSPVANHLRRASCPLVGSQWLGGCSVYPTSSARGSPCRASRQDVPPPTPAGHQGICQVAYAPSARDQPADRARNHNDSPAATRPRTPLSGQEGDLR